MAYSQTQIDELRAAIAIGATTVSFSDGRTVTYRSLHEMNTILNTMEGAVNGQRAPTHYNASYSSGL